MFEVFFVLLCGAALFGMIYGLIRYRTPLNPLTMSTALGFIPSTVFSAAIVYRTWSSLSYTEDVMTEVALISLVSYCGMVTPYMLQGSLFARLFGQLMRWLGLHSEKLATRFNPIKFIFLLCGAVVSFVALAIVGGGGLRWLTDTRNAYIQNRAGAGVFFAMMQWFLAFAFLYYLWACRPRQMFRLLIVVGLFVVGAYFTGSKFNVLSILLVAVIYYHFMVRSIRLRVFILMVPLLFMGFIGLLNIQGSTTNLLDFLFYFREPFDVTAQFISRFDEFGFRFGAASLSNLWYFVPRGLFPDKPYEYGITLIHQVLFPGAAAAGNTPGILGWALAYLDFGVVGVFIAGIWNGLFQRVMYENFLRHRQCFFAFLFMLQFSLWSPLQFATLEITVGLSMVLAIYFRIVWRRGGRMPRPAMPLADNRASL